MSTLTYKCPSCGAPLNYDGRQQEMTCGSCGNTFDPETIRAVNEIQQKDEGFEDLRWETKEEEFSQQELNETRTYSCSSCGAQLFTDETTVATECAFCGSPSVIPAQFAPGTRPEKIIPFLIEKEQAEKMFRDYFKQRKLIPNIFQKGTLQIEEIRKLYAPFWLFNGVADARMTYRGTTVSSHRSGQYMVRTTRHFLIRRAGTLDFKDLPVDASERLDNKITESIEPFRNADAVDFIPQTLSGAQAHRADLSPQQCEERANTRVRVSTDEAFRRTVGGYVSVVPESSNIRIEGGSAEPVLYPVWLITTRKQDKLYTFAINGQTGDVTTDVPWSRAKFFGRMLSMGLGVAAAGMLVVYLLSSMGVIR